MNKLIRPFSLPTLLPRDLFDDIERMFNALDWYDAPTGTVSLKRGFPKGDLFYDKDGNKVIELALAGYKKEQLSVKVNDNTLTVSAAKCDDTDEERKSTLTRRAFSQQFAIFDNNDDFENTQISYENGLLRIVVPKKETPDKEINLEIK